MKSSVRSSRSKRAPRRALLVAVTGLGFSAPLAAQTTITYSSGVTDATAYSISAPNSPFTLDIASGAATQSGVISGDGQLVKTGSGTITLTGANTHTGTTRIAAGTLSATGSAQLGATAIQLAAGTLQFTANAQTLASAITVTGANTLAYARGSNFLTSAITGDSAASLNLSQGNAAAVTLRSDLSAYAGTIILSKPAAGFTYRVDSNTPIASGANALWQLDAGTVFFYNGTASSTVVQLGGLQGSGTLRGGTAAAGAGTLTYQVGARGTSTTFSGIIENNTSLSALTKVGPGSLTLTGAHTYTGATTINAGTLLVDGSLANSTVTVGSAGSLGGAGVIAGAITIAGTLRTETAPLDNTARLTFGSTLAFAPSGTTSFDIDGANYTGVTLSAAESLTFDGGLNFTFVNGVATGTYDLFSFVDTAPGNFASVAVSGLGGLTADFFGAGHWGASFGPHTFDFDVATGDLVVAAAIPEPAGVAGLLGLVSFAVVGLRRRPVAHR